MGKISNLFKNKGLVTKEDFQNYFYEFKKIHRLILNPKFGYKVKAFVSKQQGSMIFFSFEEGSDEFVSYEIIDGKIGAALHKTPQKAFGGNLEGISFGGTNIIREANHLIFIKGDNTKNAWTSEKAQKDAWQEINTLKAIWRKEGHKI